MLMQAFAPVPGSNGTFGNSAAITVGVANVATALPLGANQSATQLRVYNTSSAAVAITPGQTAATAVAVFPTSGTPANGYVIAPGEDCIVSIPPQAAFLGVIGLAANGTVYITQGEGV